MQTQKECTGACECTFDFYADRSPECVAVADRRADVNNAGISATVDEVKDLIARAPTCLASHGTQDDWARYGVLALTARARVPIVDLMDLVAA
jgi:hypothetical protein